MRIENYITILRYLDEREWVSCNDIVREFGYSLSVVARVMRALKREGMIETRQGKGGGVRLIISFSALTLGDILPFIEAKQVVYLSIVKAFSQVNLSLFVSEWDKGNVSD